MVLQDWKESRKVDRDVQIMLEAELHLRDDSGPVDYHLTAVLFRSGHLNDGHFYIAARTGLDAWVIYNSRQVFVSVTLKKLQDVPGSNAYAVLFMRNQPPAGELPLGLDNFLLSRYTQQHNDFLQAPILQCYIVHRHEHALMCQRILGTVCKHSWHLT